MGLIIQLEAASRYLAWKKTCFDRPGLFYFIRLNGKLPIKVKRRTCGSPLKCLTANIKADQSKHQLKEDVVKEKND